jgi:hypothetical protein
MVGSLSMSELSVLVKVLVRVVDGLCATARQC